MTRTETSLRKNFSWTFLGNVVYAGCLWGILAVLTRWGSTEIVGRFALGSAIATPIMVFSYFQLRVVVSTDAKNEFEFRDYLGTRLALMPVAVLAVVIVALVLYSPEQALVIGVFGFIRFVEGFSDLFYGFAQKHERMDLVARSLWLRGMLALMFFAVIFRVTGSLPLALAGNVLAWGLVVVFFDWPRLKILISVAGESSWRPRWKKNTLRDLLFLAFPLGLVMLLINLRTTIPRAWLERSLGEEALGIFAALSYLVIAGQTVIMALSQSSIARLSRFSAAGERDRFRGTMLKLLGMGVLIGVGGVLVAAVLGSWILKTLYSPEYGEYGKLFVVIMIGGAFLYLGSILGAPMSAMRKFRIQVVVYLFNVGFLALMSWLLIPKHGLMGAAWVGVLSAVFVTFAYGFLVWRGIRRMAPPAEGAAP